MNRWLMVGALLVGVTSACGGSIEPEPRPSESGESEAIDYCERFGWYNDGTCDEVCANPDPDCSQTEPGRPGEPGTPAEPGTPGEPRPSEPGTPTEPAPVPDPECVDLEGIPEEDYVAFGDECALVDFACAEGHELFYNACGCGCTEVATTLPGMCLDDSKPDVSRVGDLEACTMIDYVCADGWYPFEDDCGCGCRMECKTDSDCPNGYCLQGTDAPQMCVYPVCDDGSAWVCDALPPECAASETAAIINGCWQCVDARSCSSLLGG